VRLYATGVRALLAACPGPALSDRRDEALVRLLTETGLRAGETVALRVEDSATTPCTSRSAAGPRQPAFAASIPMCSDIPPPTAGSPRAAVRAA
jgi:hypothetical protein